MASTVNTRLKLRADTEENWRSVDPVLLRGEAAFSYDVNKLKIGTGLKKWSQLEYLAGKGSSNVDIFRYGTCAEWDADTSLVGENGVFYIYTDYIKKADGTVIPGIKLGDGVKKLNALPFINASNGSISTESNMTVNGETKTLQEFLNAYDEHIRDKDIHTSAEEKAEWDSKVSVSIDANDPENLRFTTD